jgi:hypothetical protein
MTNCAAKVKQSGAAVKEREREREKYIERERAEDLQTHTALHATGLPFSIIYYFYFCLI